MGPKMAGDLATIFMAKVQILDKGARFGNATWTT